MSGNSVLDFDQGKVAALPYDAIRKMPDGFGVISTEGAVTICSAKARTPEGRKFDVKLGCKCPDRDAPDSAIGHEEMVEALRQSVWQAVELARLGCVQEAA